jgi:predicted Zn-dependent peptidase
LVCYHVSIPEENLETAFECISEIVKRPSFPAEEIEKEKEVVCQEIRMYKDDIDSLVSYSMMESVFNHSLAAPVIGTEESVRSITRDNLIDFNREFYSPEHQLITLCSSSDHRDLTEKYFGAIDEVLVWKPDLEPTYNAPFEKEVVKAGQLQNVISIAFGGNKIDETIKEKAAVDVFNKVFGSGDVSRLFLKIREDMGLVYGIGSYLMDNMDGNLFCISTQTEPENAAAVIKEINNQIEVMKTTLPTAEELQSAKNKIRSAEYSNVDTSRGVAIRILMEEFLNYPTTSKYLAEVDKVTPEKVKEIAEKIFANNKYTVIGHG